MSAKELAEGTAEFDRESVADTFDRPGPEAKARWARARRKRGRPVRGEGATRISVTIEKGLLRRADTFVEQSGQTRSQLIERGLKAVLSEAGS
jgi:hypothetical protein